MTIPQTQIEPSYTYGGAELFVVPSYQVPLAMPEITRHIRRIEGVAWSIEDVEQALLKGEAQGWGMRKDGNVLGFFITRIDKTHHLTFGLVWIVAGRGLEVGLPAYREVIEPWLFSQGCQYIEIHGRKGWKKILPDYSEAAIVLRKDAPQDSHGRRRQHT